MTFFRFQAVLAFKLAPTWVPKTGPKPTQNLRNRLQISTSSQDAPKMASNLEKHPKICKKISKTVSTWPPHGAQVLPKSIQKASPGQDFLGALATSIRLSCRNHIGCNLQIRSKTTMHAFAFFHIALLLCDRWVRQESHWMQPSVQLIRLKPLVPVHQSNLTAHGSVS